jgi:hypothetical protein
MKMMIKLAAVLLVIALFLPMWLKGPDGKPIMTIGDWVKLPTEVNAIVDGAGDLVEKLGAPVRETFEAGPEAADSPSGEYYRWQDEEGQWHFSDQPPAGAEPTLVADKLPEVRNSMGPIELPVVDDPAPTGAKPAMSSNITPPLPEGISREAIEQQLQGAHERRMGEHL